eukprot:CAMPEP_0172737460 /NCGR_PEP_ID=MMETSP1074-20121228/117711_1 /TAXON_ID=2916 /ORGANISM="Ceratium fusus, Strain PA161109" /LENGTH=85 /DNA_ID=CAMNT_0013566861 /DNA_START=479 /DNA_END=736 /DNA_ORIENTATION=+
MAKPLPAIVWPTMIQRLAHLVDGAWRRMILGYQCTWKLLMDACGTILRSIKRGPLPVAGSHEVVGSWAHCWKSFGLNLWPCPKAL